MTTRHHPLLLLSLLTAALSLPAYVAGATETTTKSAESTKSSDDNSADDSDHDSDDASLPRGATFSTVPKVYVLSIGGITNYSSRLPNRDDAQPGKASRGLSGGELMGEWLWQLGGFRSDWPVWLGYYLGWLHLPGSATTQRTGVLEYGIRVRHGYRITPNIRPFFTYCLGATQVWIDGVPGRGITHQTRTGIGVDLKMGHRTRLLISTEWIRQSLPDLGSDVDRSFSGVTLNVGVIFERPAK